jgi:hypothetical protein
MSDDELENIISINVQLDKIPPSEQSIEYQGIVHAVKTYLKNRCDHNFLYDYVDIDPDTSKQICYCNKCYTSFS